MNYFKQILYELKNQKMMTWVSISGTALAIFLIMAIFMSERLKQLDIAPMTQRDRIMTGQGIDFSESNQSASAMGIDYDLAEKLYSNLDGVEKISFIKSIWGRLDIGVPDGETMASEILGVDDQYWKIYDYKFLSGTSFEKEEVDAEIKNVIITESVAHQLFNDTEVAGKEILIDNVPFMIKGVVQDSYSLLQDGNIGAFIIFTKDPPRTYYEGIFGNTNVRLLLKEGIDPDYIKNQVAKRYEDLNRFYEKENKVFSYHNQPYTSEDLNSGFFGSNNAPPVKEYRIRMAIYYIFLFLLPAINLSSMTRSRLRSRITEIGVRRAFGAKKTNIISQIFTENFLISLAGGIIGLILSVLLLLFMSDYFISKDDLLAKSMLKIEVAPVIPDIFDWGTFFIAIGACFVLNILSATLPSWMASRVVPALAISKSK